MVRVFYLLSLLFTFYSFIFTLPKNFCPSISYTKLGSSYNEHVNFCILRVESLILHYKSSSRILITSKPINLKTSNLNDKLEQLIALFEKEYGCKPIIYLGSFCCWKVIPTVYDCPIWLRFLKVYHIIPNTTIKQAAIVDNLDRNYCKDIDAIILKK